MAISSTITQLASQPIDAKQHHGEARNQSQRLRSLNPTIRELMRISGTVGLSVGVHRKGLPRYVANFGFRDNDNKLPITGQTILNACSLSKFFVAMTMARAVDDPTSPLTWESLVRDTLPGFAIDDDLIRENLNMVDLLSHRSGLSTGPNRRGGNNQMMGPFRQKWGYNNVGYETAGLVLDEVTGSWAKTMREELLVPLGMKRSSLYHPVHKDENVAKVYGTLDNRSPVEISSAAAEEGSVVGGPGGGLFTCVDDLLNAYAAALEAFKDQVATGDAKTEGSPIRRAANLLSAKIPMLRPTYRELSYALGMCRIQLPGPMGQIGNNADLIPDMPVVGKGAPSTLVFCHQGSRPGTLCAMAMLPELDTSVVVMSNSLGLNDCPDWVLQLVIEELLAVLGPDRNDYLDYARKSAAATYNWERKRLQRWHERVG
ncbi:Uu.00g017140.m01.CDS01 [Anthostomella pinea]|uniref:Uu.00g017140.m01.CDS01 n=1 Tax=Anthostomella pinea TaxID=933095 RepID=A0AAI8YQK8_9PEZI|nr:Uu.00g017140.m01.CDS01 [Anthostomella pinea]